MSFGCTGANKEKRHGNEEDLALTLNKFATLYFREQKYAKAEALYKRSLELRIKSLGSFEYGANVLLNHM